ncbi:MAG TPA: type I pullulanase [Verrucomicrobiae bacterium]
MLRISLNLARRGGLGWLCTLPLVLALGVQFASQAEVGPAQPDLASYRYPDADLGAAYSPAATQFKLWAPTATAVAVVLYADATQAATVTVPLQRSPTGIWSGSIAGDCQGKYYQYAITHPSTTDRPETLLVNDPYAHGTSVNSGRTLIFDSRQTDPPGWAADHPVVQAQNVDAVIYEIHTRDFTLHPSAGTAPDRRGKYLGLIQTGAKTPTGQATGLDHLVELGVTHVQLLPTYDFAAGNERQTAADYDWYSWGYDPLLYQNPEGSYASNPDDTSRQRELKQVVQSFHQHGLGVVLDVVFNHTAATGTGPASVFDKVYPGYFYRRDAAGHYVNGTGCGNELASEKPMVRKFIVDSIKYWLTEYHVDGFRFDLMGILDRETMLEVYREAKAINPSVMIYGEGWRMEPLLPAERMMTQDHVAGTGIAAFNDGIRDNIKGDNDAQALGFVQGGGAPHGGWSRFAAELKGQSTAKDSQDIEVFSPNETINYDSVHDDLCLWDKLTVSTPEATPALRQAMDKLAAGILLTAQGVPLIHGGDDFLRSKQGNGNSYNNNDPRVNPIDWNLKSEHREVFDYYRGLIALRRAHPAFRLSHADEVDARLHFLKPMPDRVLAFQLTSHANGDGWENIVVIYNGNRTAQTVEIPGQWKVVADATAAGTNILAEVAGKFSLAPCSLIVAHD